MTFLKVQVKDDRCVGKPKLIA